MTRPERGRVKDSNPPNAEEAERFDGDEIPENLAKEIEAARKRVADSEIGE